MRMSNLFSKTLRQDPADTEVISHKLLVRAGFIQQIATGIFSYLPLAKRSLTKIENIMRDAQIKTENMRHDAEVKIEDIRHKANVEIAEKIKEKVNLNLSTEDIAKIFNK